MRAQFGQMHCTQQNREIKVRTIVYCSTLLHLILFWKKFLILRFCPKNKWKNYEKLCYHYAVCHSSVLRGICA
jgi:hypothetical protein